MRTHRLTSLSFDQIGIEAMLYVSFVGSRVGCTSLKPEAVSTDRTSPGVLETVACACRCVAPTPEQKEIVNTRPGAGTDETANALSDDGRILSWGLGYCNVCDDLCRWTCAWWRTMMISAWKSRTSTNPPLGHLTIWDDIRLGCRLCVPSLSKRSSQRYVNRSAYVYEGWHLQASAWDMHADNNVDV
jgi:hypothetical protein